MTSRLTIEGRMSAAGTAAVLDALEAGGAAVRFVGGCVRDALLGWPVRDIDVATDALPEKVIDILGMANIKVVPTGLDHGTVTAVADGHPIEITTLRRDVETDGRYATVAFTDDWTEDAARRDFTINALSLSRDGRLHDPFGGEEDLKRGRVRFVGDAKARIAEDVLRVLRFFRFHAYYGKGPLDPDGLAACRDMAPRLRRLSAERVWSELRALLAASDPAPIVEAMLEVGVVPVLMPEATAVDRLVRLVKAEAVAAARWPAMVAADPVRRLAALLTVAPDDADAMARRLRLSTAERERLVAVVVALREPPEAADGPAARRSLYRTTVDGFVDAALANWAEDGRESYWLGALAVAADWTAPAFPLKGKDVTALGVSPGPRVGRLLAEVEDWWVSEDFAPDRDACLAHLRALAKG